MQVDEMDSVTAGAVRLVWRGRGAAVSGDHLGHFIGEGRNAVTDYVSVLSRSGVGHVVLLSVRWLGGVRSTARIATTRTDDNEAGPGWQCRGRYDGHHKGLLAVTQRGRSRRCTLGR